MNMGEGLGEGYGDMVEPEYYDGRVSQHSRLYTDVEIPVVAAYDFD